MDYAFFCRLCRKVCTAIIQELFNNQYASYHIYVHNFRVVHISATFDDIHHNLSFFVCSQRINKANVNYRFLLYQ